MTATDLAPARRRDPETTRVEILEAAIEVAGEIGGPAFTLDAVVNRLPVSKGALLHHFPTKLALLEGMVDHLGQMFVDEVLAEAARDPQPYGRNARAYLRATVNDTATPRDINIGRAVLVACAVEPALMDRWKVWMQRVSADDPTDPVGADDALMLRLIADGLWLSDLFGIQEISPAQRKALLSLLTPGTVLFEPAA